MAWEFTKNPVRGEILIGLPYKQNFSAKFVKGLMGLQFPDMFSHSVMFQTGQPLDQSRNIMVSYALQRNVSHLFFLDEDIILKPETITELHEQFMPILGAVYFGRSPPYDVVANIYKNAISRNDVVERLEKSAKKKAIMEVHEMGLGSCLIDMRVFKRIAQHHNLPWYCLQKHGDKFANLEKNDTGIFFENKEAVEVNYSCPECKNTLIAPFFDYRIGKNSENALSEDYYFCKLAREAGFSVYLSLHTQVEHEITMFTIDINGLTNSTQSAGVI